MLGQFAALLVCEDDVLSNIQSAKQVFPLPLHRLQGSHRALDEASHPSSPSTLFSFRTFLKGSMVVNIYRQLLTTTFNNGKNLDLANKVPRKGIRQERERER